jgi:hypothetical protein
MDYSTFNDNQLDAFKKWFTHFILSIFFIQLFMFQYLDITYLPKYSNEIYGYLLVYFCYILYSYENYKKIILSNYLHQD